MEKRPSRIVILPSELSHLSNARPSETRSGRIRIIAFAYACEPDKGSEPGAGWMWCRMLAQIGEVHVITRANNRGAIENALSAIREADRLRFIYVDVPVWLSFWKRGQRGVRLYYLLWQIAALRQARTLHRQIAFDLVWHLTLANVWLGSLAGLVGPTFVYGPVGGGVSAPWRLLPSLGFRGAAYEVARSIVRLVGRYANPLARVGWRRATLILAQNPETRDWLPRVHYQKIKVFPNAVLEALPANRSRQSFGPPIALFVGRLLPWKGAGFAICAISELPDWRLRVIGEGSDEARLRLLTKRLRLTDRVEFVGQQPRGEVLRQMAEEADLLLFPSLHDDSPFVVAEAIAAGLPIVCVDRGGPPLVAGGVARAASGRQNSPCLVSELAHLVQESDGYTRKPGRNVSAFPDPRERARELLISSRAGELGALLRNSIRAGPPKAETEWTRA